MENLRGEGRAGAQESEPQIKLTNVSDMCFRQQLVWYFDIFVPYQTIVMDPDLFKIVPYGIKSMSS